MRISDWSSDVCSSDLGRSAATTALPLLGGTFTRQSGSSPPSGATVRMLSQKLSLPASSSASTRPWSANSRSSRAPLAWTDGPKIGRAHVCTPVTTAHLVCSLLLEKQKQHNISHILQ